MDLPRPYKRSSPPSIPGSDRVYLDGELNRIEQASGTTIDAIATLDATVSAISAPARTVNVFEGDSLSDVLLYGLWPSLLQDLSAYFADCDHHYYALSGDLASNMLTEYATEAAIHAPVNGNRARFFPGVGTNDINGGVPAATIYNDYLVPLWAQANTDGFEVVASTLPPYYGWFGTAKQVQWAELNRLILSNQTLYWKVRRPDLWFPDPTDTYLYRDGAHLTDAGNRRMAQLVIELVVGGQLRTTVVDTRARDNRVINGGMKVSQELGSTALAGGNGFVVDGWQSRCFGSSLVVDVQQVTDAPLGQTNSIKVTVPTAKSSLVSTDHVILFQNIPGDRIADFAWGTGAAREATVGFSAKAHWTGGGPKTFSGTAQQYGGLMTWPFLFTLTASDVWQPVPIHIVGPNAGTWLTGAAQTGIQLNVCVAAGSAMVGAADAWVTAGYVGATGTGNGVSDTTDTFQLTDVVVLPGYHEFSGTDRLQRPEMEELALCQQQLEYKTHSPRFTAGGVGYWSFPLSFAPKVSDTPSITVVSTGATANLTGAVTIDAASTTKNSSSFTLLSAGAGDTYSLATKFRIDNRIL